MMEHKWMVFGIVCLLLSILVVLLERHEKKKLLDHLHKMLDEAINGQFQETVFDESKCSALESRLAQYLAASQLSAKNVKTDKKKIETLIADISHQTRTPLSNLLLYEELLGEQELNETSKEYLNLMHLQTEKLSFLITSLVKLSRLEAGILVLRPVKQEICPMVKKVTEGYQALARAKGLELKFEELLDTESPICAVYDEKWTGEALGNLIENAIKYTTSGKITVRIKPYQMFTCVEVEDTGAGIAEEEQAKIFSRFYRGSQNAAEEGVGIGLFLTREILRKEHGYIKVASKAGAGSRFGMYLPNLSKM